ncbi:S-adenosyl-L-methionine-dependent methyltransferase [Synechococcus sp. PROS-7-1]|nr:S-adenosyl-L-methionine-dependent methyltransferase [Synechococcus sp. PROS-7-1]
MRNLADRQDVEKIECQLSTLDNFSSQLSSDSRCDFVKCDVEGNELFVMQGGLEFINTHKPILFLELLRKWSAPFGCHPNDVLHLMRGMGYSVFVASSDCCLDLFDTVTDETIHTNYFFVHPDSRLRSFLPFM